MSRVLAAVFVCAVVLSSAADARAGGRIGTRCDVDTTTGFAIATVVVWNPNQRALDYDLVVELRAGADTWRSQPLVGTLAPGQRLERTFRPFGRGVTPSSCTFPSALTPGATPGQVDSVHHYNDTARAVAGWFAGVGVALVTTYGGAALGSSLDCGAECDNDSLTGVLVGGLLGYVIGFPVGFGLVASHPDSNSWGFAAGMLGSFLGGGLIVLAAIGEDQAGDLLTPALLLPQLGTIAGFYFAHRHLPADPPATGALLELRDGGVALGVPVPQRYRSGNTMVTALPILGGRF